MSIENLRLSSAFVLRLREYNFNNDQMISFAVNLNKHIDVLKLSELMKTGDISFNYDTETNIFELIDPSALMGTTHRVIKLDSIE